METEERARRKAGVTCNKGERGGEERRWRGEQKEEEKAERLESRTERRPLAWLSLFYGVFLDFSSS